MSLDDIGFPTPDINLEYAVASWKHSISKPQFQSTSDVRKTQPNIAALLTKEEALLPQKQLRKTLIRWIIEDKQAFTTIELPSFQQIFQDIPGIALPFNP